MFDNLIKYIYFVMIKKLIREKIHMIYQNIYNYYIEQNIIDAYQTLKKKKKIKRDIFYLNSYIIFIIEFYSKEQIKNNINKNENVLISISTNDYLIIYLFNLLKNTEK